MSELRNFHMLLLAAEYVEGDAALRAEIWAEMDAVDCHRQVRPRLSSTLQQSRSPSAPAHRPVLRSSSTLQQNRSPSAPLAHEVVPRVQYRSTAASTGVRTGVRTRSSRLNPEYRNSEPVALTMITGLRNVPIRQETRRLTERPEPLPVAPRPSQQLPSIHVRPSRETHQLPPIPPRPPRPPPRPSHQLPLIPPRPPRPAQQLPPISARRPVQTQQLRSIAVRRPVQTRQLPSIPGRPPVATQQLPSLPRPLRPVDNPRGLQSVAPRPPVRPVDNPRGFQPVAPRPPVRPVDNLRASQNRSSIPATPMSYLDKGKGKLDIELCELEVADQLLNLRYLPMHPSNIASSSR